MVHQMNNQDNTDLPSDLTWKIGKKPNEIKAIIKEARATKKTEKEIAGGKSWKKWVEPPIKYYYDVKIETYLPATLHYRVLAEDAQQASELIRGMPPTGVKHKLVGRKDIRLLVYDAGSTLIKYIKNLGR